MARWGVITALDVITEVDNVQSTSTGAAKQADCKHRSSWWCCRSTSYRKTRSRQATQKCTTKSVTDGSTQQNSKKSIIVFIFSFRLIVAAFSLATLVAYSKFFSEYTRISIGIARTVAWQEFLLCFSLMTASIPCLRTFLDAFTSTGLMTVHGRNIISCRPPGYGTSSQTQQSKSQNPTAKPTSPKPRLRPALGHRHSSGISQRLRPDRSGYKANVQAQDASAQGSRPAMISKLSRTPESFETLRPDQLEIHRDVEVCVTHS